jgi:general stress protein 26
MPTVSPSSAQAQRLRELIRDVKYAMFTTRSVDGTLTSRPMTTLQTEFDGTLWFIASSDSLKALDIDERPKVNLGYAAPDDGRYVSVSGTARVLHDAAKARELWRAEFDAWFPNGPDDPNVAVLQVEIASADYWETPAGGAERVYASEQARQGDREALGQQTHLEFGTGAQERSTPGGSC